MSKFDEEGVLIAQGSLPREQGTTFEAFCRSRGYDPATGTYADDDTPDYGAVSRLPKLRQTP